MTMGPGPGRDHASASALVSVSGGERAHGTWGQHVHFIVFICVCLNYADFNWCSLNMLPLLLFICFFLLLSVSNKHLLFV